MAIKIVNIDEKNFSLIPKPTDKRFNCQECFYWVGKRDGRLDLVEQKKKWFLKRAEKHKPLGKLLFLSTSKDPVGFAQFGPITDFSTARFFYQGKIIPKNGWCITCVTIKTSFRRQGLASKLIKSILADLKRRGAKSVDAFPLKNTKSINEVSCGPKSLYEGLGFKDVFETGGYEPVAVMRKILK